MIHDCYYGNQDRNSFFIYSANGSVAFFHVLICIFNYLMVLACSDATSDVLLFQSRGPLDSTLFQFQQLTRLGVLHAWDKIAFGVSGGVSHRLCTRHCERLGENDS